MAHSVMFAIIAVVVLTNGTFALTWISPGLTVETGCRGSHVIFPCFYESSQQLLKIQWFKLSEKSMRKDYFASYSNYVFRVVPGNHDLDGRVSRVEDKQGQINITDLRPQDAGIYGVEVEVQTKVQNKEKNVKSFCYYSLTVTEPPEASVDPLLHLATADDGGCAAGGRLALTYGPFTSPGIPPVSVTCTDPAGQSLSTSDYKDGHFHLLLPGKALPGNYTCGISCTSAAFTCLPPDSPLRRHYVMLLDRALASQAGCTDVHELFREKADVSADVLSALLKNITAFQAKLEELQNWKQSVESEVQKMQQKSAAHEGRIQAVNRTCQMSVDTLTGHVTPVEWSDPMSLNPTRNFTISDPNWKILRSLALTDDGIFVAGDHEKCDVILASMEDPNLKTMRRLAHGNKVMAVTLLPQGSLAVTVDDKHILVAEIRNMDLENERWLVTLQQYWGTAARSDNTLFVGVRASGGAAAQVDVISTEGEEAEVISTVLSDTTTPELQCPDSLTLHGNDLYISDSCTNYLICLHLDTGDVTLQDGPLFQPDLRFLGPHRLAFDHLGNMILATGGTVCGNHGDRPYERGFCVVLMAQNGGFRKLLQRGQHVYPYGVVVTTSGIAVTWVSYVNNAPESLIQVYEFQ